MNKTGSYRWDGEKMIKFSDELPKIERPIYFNKGGTAYFDKTARRTFESKADKRKLLKDNKMREGGIVNPKDVGL